MRGSRPVLQYACKTWPEGTLHDITYSQTGVLADPDSGQSHYCSLELLIYLDVRGSIIIV